MAEKPLTNRVMAAIRAGGGWCFKALGSGMTERGVPDVVGCSPIPCGAVCSCGRVCGAVRGVFVGIESKDGGRSGTEASPIQVWQLELIVEAGGMGMVVRTEEDYRQFLEVLSGGVGEPGRGGAEGLER
jgi:hypothetical protein